MARVRNRYLLLADALFLTATPFFLYALRFEGSSWGAQHQKTALMYTVLLVPLCIAIFFSFGLYRRLWRYASVAELELIFVAGVAAALASAALGGLVLPRSGLTPV